MRYLHYIDSTISAHCTLQLLRWLVFFVLLSPRVRVVVLVRCAVRVAFTLMATSLSVPFESLLHLILWVMHSISDHVWACLLFHSCFCFAGNVRTCVRHTASEWIWLYINKTGRTHFQHQQSLGTGLFRAIASNPVVEQDIFDESCTWSQVFEQFETKINWGVIASIVWHEMRLTSSAEYPVHLSTGASCLLHFLRLTISGKYPQRAPNMWKLFSPVCSVSISSCNRCQTSNTKCIAWLGKPMQTRIRNGTDNKWNRWEAMLMHININTRKSSPYKNCEPHPPLAY